MTLGEEPGRVSIADYDALWSGDDYIVPDGYGTLLARYAEGLPIRLGTPVREIARDGAGIAVSTERGTVRAGAVIVTVSVGVLRGEAIRFRPGLPAETLTALDGLGMGAYTKIALRLDRGKAEPPPLVDLIEIGEDGPLVSVEFWPQGSDLAVAVLGGDHARRVCEAGEAAAVDYLTERLVAMVGGQLRGAVRGGRLAGWWTDPFARGSYSIARPGRVAAREALRAPVAEGILIAGEATAGGGAMTAGGATLEGERAARQLLRPKT